MHSWSVVGFRTMTLIFESQSHALQICALGVNKVCIASRLAGSCWNVNQSSGGFVVPADLSQNVSKRADFSAKEESVSKGKNLER